MPKLWLKFEDDDEVENRVAVERDVFTVGRHSENDLTITDSRLSRGHIRIERLGRDFFVSDLGSSNGTFLHNSKVSERTELKDGDALNLGGLKIVVEISAVDADEAADATPGAGEFPTVIAPEAFPPDVPIRTAIPPAGGENNAIPLSFFFIAPLLGIIILVVAGGFVLFFSGDDKTTARGSGDSDYSTNDDEDAQEKDEIETRPSPAVKTASTVAEDSTAKNAVSDQIKDTPPSPTQNINESEKIERNGAAFLRRIAQNDPKAFLTGEQARRVNLKVGQLGKAGLAENISSARKNAAQIRSIAESRNLKPQFLAVAAIAKLGAARGDVLRTAQNIADVFEKLGPQIGNERADDALLMIAAYDQGAAGDTMKMRNMLQDLANKTAESARAIRSVWFLEKNGKITSGEFENALTFLAIGIITQNPREFGVNTEALNL